MRDSFTVIRSVRSGAVDESTAVRAVLLKQGEASGGRTGKSRLSHCLLCSAMLAACMFCVCAAGQDTVQTTQSSSQRVEQPASPAPADAAQVSGVPVFRINGREVLVDVIALGAKGQPVLDLKPAELQVTQAPESDGEAGGDRKRRNAANESGTIASLQVVDPNAVQASDTAGGGIQIAASCLERSTMHYRLAFRAGPDAWRSGYHRVAITTTRRGVRLFYPHRYYVGLTEPPAKPPVTESRDVDKLLLQAACYYPSTPPSISLQAKLIDTGRVDVLRYSVAIDANSLSFVTLKGSERNVGIDRRSALDYGICTFDNKGSPIQFFHAPVDQVLTSAAYARALDRGYPHVLEFAAPPQLALTRFVVRDRATGNLGAVDVLYPKREPAPPMNAANAEAQTAADLRAARSWLNLDWTSDNAYRANHPPAMVWPPPLGPIGSFGSIVRSPHSFCGDVYELPSQSQALPDFRELDPIGSIYTPVLDVPDQQFSNTTGIPGVTPRTNLFGIVYRGIFWVQVAGDYEFLMAADDGAILRIDDKKVIDLDGLHMVKPTTGKIRLAAGPHSIEVPYYQGAVNAVALELWVKIPGEHNWMLFDLNDYAPPAANAGADASQ